MKARFHGENIKERSEVKVKEFVLISRLDQSAFSFSEKGLKGQEVEKPAKIF